MQSQDTGLSKTEKEKEKLTKLVSGARTAMLQFQQTETSELSDLINFLQRNAGEIKEVETTHNVVLSLLNNTSSNVGVGISRGIINVMENVVNGDTEEELATTDLLKLSKDIEGVLRIRPGNILYKSISLSVPEEGEVLIGAFAIANESFKSVDIFIKANKKEKKKALENLCNFIIEEHEKVILSHLENVSILRQRRERKSTK